jgi:hypothetical protein
MKKTEVLTERDYYPTIAVLCHAKAALTLVRSICLGIASGDQAFNLVSFAELTLTEEFVRATMSNGDSGAGQQASSVHNNPYKAQRPWPPDFSKMDPKGQFRLERRFRRRAKLAYTRPGWIKGVKLAQYGSVMGS